MKLPSDCHQCFSSNELPGAMWVLIRVLVEVFSMKGAENSRARTEKCPELQLPVFFPIYFSDRFASILLHQGTEFLRASGAGTQKPFPWSHGPLCAVTAPSRHPRTQNQVQYRQLYLPPSQQPGPTRLFANIPSFQAASALLHHSGLHWHVRLRTSPGAASANILSLGLHTHHLSQPLSRQCPEPSQA